MSETIYFINDSNNIIPFFIIETSVIYKTVSTLIHNISAFITMIAQILTLTVYTIEYTITSILTDLFIFGQNNISKTYKYLFQDQHEQLFIILSIIAFIALFIYDKYTNMNNYHKLLIDKIDEFEHEITILKKFDYNNEAYYLSLLRKYDYVLNNIENYELDINTKIKSLEKKLKKYNKELHQYA